ncbi:MAG: sulfurtransferase [Actinomycetes bacterium]
MSDPRDPSHPSDPSDPLVDVTTLAALREAVPPPVLLDVRWRLGGPPGAEAYAEGHLPGAVFCDLDRDLAGTPGVLGRHPLPGAEHVTRAMRRLGVSPEDEVVVYDDADATAAARAWWTLRYYGHDRVRVLDGGYRAWTRAGLPVTTDVPTPRPGTFTARPGGMPLLDGDAAARLARDGVLLDARAAARYAGEQEPVDPVAGHIPGAVSAPATGNVDPTGCLLDPARLRARFAALGVNEATPVGAYCGSGVVAAHHVLALHRAAVDAALYVGSWSSWVADADRPVATGSDPG